MVTQDAKVGLLPVIAAILLGILLIGIARGCDRAEPVHRECAGSAPPVVVCAGPQCWVAEVVGAAVEPGATLIGTWYFDAGRAIAAPVSVMRRAERSGLIYLVAHQLLI